MEEISCNRFDLVEERLQWTYYLDLIPRLTGIYRSVTSRNMIGGLQRAPIEVKQDVASKIVEGQSNREIASKIGVHPSTVSHFRQTHRHEIETIAIEVYKGIAKPLQAFLLKSAETAEKLSRYFAGDEDHGCETIIERVKKVKADALGNVSEDFGDVLKLYQIEGARLAKFAEGMGILPSNTQALVIQNVYNDNRKGITNPLVMEVVAAHFEAKMAGVKESDEGDLIRNQTVEKAVKNEVSS